MLLGAERLLSGATKELLDRSEKADRDVTNQLYADYKDLRGKLMGFVADQHATISVEDRIRVVQNSP